MKPYCFLLLPFVYFSSYAQWQWSNPKPSGYINHSVIFTDAQNGFIINSNGDLLRTTDQGNSWHIQQNIQFGRTLMYKDSTLVVTSFASVYVSKDMGQTWEKHTIDRPEYLDAQIISRDTIFVSTVFPNSTYLFLSADRGNTWQQTNPGIMIKSLWMFNSKEGFAAGYNYIYKTNDGGHTWTIPDSSAPGGSNAIKFRDRNNGFVFGQGHLWRTIDGGLHWGASPSQVGSPIDAIEFIDANTVIAVGDYGIMLRSTDNGVTWPGVPVDQVYAYDLYSVCFIDQNVGFAVGHRGRILKTINSGLTWTQYAPTYIDMNALDFITDSIGFAATWYNIYKTTNGGVDWEELNYTVSERIQYMHFFNKDTGLILTETPVRIFKTYNGGANWQEINLNNLYNDDILGVFFLNKTVYLSTGGSLGNKILKSVNAGDTWIQQSIRTSNSIGDISFADEKTGYGTSGYYVYKTIDSAKTWTQLNMFPVQLLRSLWFVDDSVGYAVGDQTYITKTSDGGNTWTQLRIDATNTNIPGDLKQIKFFNEKIGYVISGRNIYVTASGGNKWVPHGTLAYELSGIEIPPDSNVFVYGIYGDILKKSIRSHQVDNLSIDSSTGCTSHFSATVTAILSSADSIWFQYGASGYDKQLAATPFTIIDTSLTVNAYPTGLTQHTSYKVRLKLHYDGNYYYSDSSGFSTLTLETPEITLRGGTLYSSLTSDNQWYLNDVPIPGATQSSYTPTQAGSYTVRTNTAGCSSDVSLPFSFVITGINDPLLSRAINIFPNPVTNTLNIQNNDLKKLKIKIFNTLGVEVSEQLTSKKENMIDMRRLPQGSYMVNITDTKTSKSIQRLVIKL
jgi:photosystem II stability/assembly factor-like uncharacterized protein